jgi:hypothetical protein
MSGNSVERDEWDTIVARIRVDEPLLTKANSLRISSRNLQLLQMMHELISTLLQKYSADRGIRPVVVFRKRLRLAQELLQKRMQNVEKGNQNRAIAGKRRSAANDAVLALVDNGVLKAIAKQAARLQAADAEIEQRTNIAVAGGRKLIEQRAAIAEAANLDNGMDFIKALDGPREDSNG